jgi:FkbM family methyltransferase
MDRERTAFDRACWPHGERLILFGAGGLGRKTLTGLRKVGNEPLAFVDNDRSLWGKDVDGMPVLSPHEAARRYAVNAAFVVTIWRGESDDRMAERMQQLIDLGCRTVVPFMPLFWKYAEEFVPHYAIDVPHQVSEQAEEIRSVFHLWADEGSRREYVAELRWRMLGDFDALPMPVDHEIYFPEDLVSLQPDEVFVDCGAFDGDTIRSLLDRLDEPAGVVAFEPDAANFGLLRDYVASLPSVVGDRVTVYQAAVGSNNCKVKFDATGTEASSVGSGLHEVDCLSLDEIFHGRCATYMKMDIEGSELDALVGARTLIPQCLPVLAVCVYHRQDHLWRVPAAIRAMSDKYRFFLRPHLLEGWDLVCYAVPEDRLRMPRLELRS